MTPEQKTLVQASFAKVLPIADLAATIFYQRLFELDPSLRPLFKDDMTEQRRALMGILKVAVAGLDRLDELVPTVQGLGRRHAGYGVQDAHYATVGAALLWTLAQGLGDAFTPPVAAAWAAVYTILADTMKAAANEPTQAAHGRSLHSTREISHEPVTA
ncbi:MAG: globin domain-containing protein [Chloroflexota bacterium]|nr:globin domain-containing protein [Chloroflexota bacterium]